MDIVEKLEKPSGTSIRNQLASLLLSATAGFLASKLVESAYEKFVINRNTTTPTETS